MARVAQMILAGVALLLASAAVAAAAGEPSSVRVYGRDVPSQAFTAIVIDEVRSGRIDEFAANRILQSYRLPAVFEDPALPAWAQERTAGLTLQGKQDALLTRRFVTPNGIASWDVAAPTALVVALLLAVALVWRLPPPRATTTGQMPPASHAH